MSIINSKQWKQSHAYNEQSRRSNAVQYLSRQVLRIISAYLKGRRLLQSIFCASEEWLQ